MTRKIIDLSHIIQEGMPVYPGTKPPVLDPVCTVEIDGFKETAISLYTHTGTHIDVPSHLLKDGKTLSDYPVNTFFGEALMIDCMGVNQIDLSFFEPWEQVLKKYSFVILKTGWSRHWGTEKYFRDYPVLTDEAARFLATSLIVGVGVDAISVDPVENNNLPNHHILFNNEKIIIENLTQLNEVTGSEFVFSCLPLKIDQSDGAPVRAVAIL